MTRSIVNPSRAENVCMFRRNRRYRFRAYLAAAACTIECPDTRFGFGRLFCDRAAVLGVSLFTADCRSGGGFGTSVADCGFRTVGGASCVIIENVICKAVSQCVYRLGFSNSADRTGVCHNACFGAGWSSNGYAAVPYVRRHFACLAANALVPMVIAVEFPVRSVFVFVIGVKNGNCFFTNFCAAFGTSVNTKSGCLGGGSDRYSAAVLGMSRKACFISADRTLVPMSRFVRLPIRTVFMSCCGDSFGGGKDRAAA